MVSPQSSQSQKHFISWLMKFIFILKINLGIAKSNCSNIINKESNLKWLERLSGVKIFRCSPDPLPLFSRSCFRLSLVSRVLSLVSRSLARLAFSRSSRHLSLVSRVVSLVSRFGLLVWDYDMCLWCMIYVYVDFSFLEWVSKKVLLEVHFILNADR